MFHQPFSDKDTSKTQAKKAALSNKTINQNLLSGAGSYRHLSIDTLQVLTYKEWDVKSGIVKTFVDFPGPVGISPGLDSKDQSIIALAICNDKRCLIVEFPHKPRYSTSRRGRNESPDSNEGFDEVESPNRDTSPIQVILARHAGIFAFDLAPLALALYSNLGLRVLAGVDIQSVFSDERKTPLDAIREIIGDQSGVKVNNDIVSDTFRDHVYDPKDHGRFLDIAQRAWISQFLPTFENATAQFDLVKKIDTKQNNFTSGQLNVLAKWAQDSTRLEYLQPVETTHDFTMYQAGPASGRINVQSGTYKTKIRSDQTVQLSIQGSRGEQYYLKGVTGAVDGRSASLVPSYAMGTTDNKVVTTITSVGRDGPTQAQARRAATVLSILQKSSKMFSENPWIQNFWFPSENGLMIWPHIWSLHRSTGSFTLSEDHKKTLNSSQIVAVESMLSDKDSDRVILVQGPPGSGKTSVIARFVELAIQNGTSGIWLVAQSNVAVKNIAEKLMSIGFGAWRILVSKDFHFEWHEHLYGQQLQDKIIRSEEFKTVNPRSFSDCHVILCTLSMISSRWLFKFTRTIPLHTLVVDEASQIETGDYLPVFSVAQHSLRKMCLIGDDKQLPPFGQEDIGTLQSVFEIDHLRSHIVFLDTQYRMPPQIGSFISKEVYNNQLKSNPNHPIKEDVIACKFVDALGNEQMQNKSFMNISECEAVIKIAKHLQDTKKSYRIITPYDGQRNYIQRQMEAKELEWSDKCFNVDSFQGNEDDYIIISIVRSMKIGFLNNLRRTNVMLSRCKKGMFIVSSRRFLSGVGKLSLVGALLEHLEGKVGEAAWLTPQEIEEGRI